MSRSYIYVGSYQVKYDYVGLNGLGLSEHTIPLDIWESKRKLKNKKFRGRKRK